jgi:hypothetical protein
MLQHAIYLISGFVKCSEHAFQVAQIIVPKLSPQHLQELLMLVQSLLRTCPQAALVATEAAIVVDVAEEIAQVVAPDSAVTSDLQTAAQVIQENAPDQAAAAADSPTVKKWKPAK